MGIGILIKNMLVALVVGILLGFLVEPIVSIVFFLKRWDQLLNLMPSGATNAMLEITSPVLFAGHDPTPWWLAAWSLRHGACCRRSLACCPPSVATLPDCSHLEPQRQHACARIFHRSSGSGAAAGLDSAGMARVVVDVMPKPEILDPRARR